MSSKVVLLFVPFTDSETQCCIFSGHLSPWKPCTSEINIGVLILSFLSTCVSKPTVCVCYSVKFVLAICMMRLWRLQVHCGVQQRRATSSLPANKGHLQPVGCRWSQLQGQPAALPQPRSRGLASHGEAGAGWVSDAGLTAGPHQRAGHHTGTSRHRYSNFNQWLCNHVKRQKPKNCKVKKTWYTF